MDKIDILTEEERSIANKIILEEMVMIQDQHQMEEGNLSLVNIPFLWNEVKKEIIYIPKEKRYDIKFYVRFYHINEVKDHEKFDHKNQVFEIGAKYIEKEELYCKKMEEKANLLTAGYIKRFNSLIESYNNYKKEIEELKRLKVVFETLYEQEKNSITNRKNELEKELNIFKEKERKLQRTYKRLKEKLSNLV